jgi:hypothetical protein
MRTRLVIVIIIGFLFILANRYYFSSSADNRKFSNIELAEGHGFKIAPEHLTAAQTDSLEAIQAETSKIEIVGSGYTGYDFFMWHKPTEKGELYIKAFEVTTNERLSSEELTERTMHSIREVSSKYQIYKGQSVIYEGTFEKYYPARFELWFKSSENGKEQKLTEKTYLIDGWDR